MNERRGYRGMNMQADYGDEDRGRRGTWSDDERYGRQERGGLWDRVRSDMREGWESLSGRDDLRDVRRDPGASYGHEFGGRRESYDAPVMSDQGYASRQARMLGGGGSFGGNYGYGGSRDFGFRDDDRTGYGLHGTDMGYGRRFDRDRDERGLWDRAKDEMRESWESVKETFQGKGPKGYKRSDDRIREDVCDRLTRHHAVDATEIEISVRDGEVTLSGTVLDRRQKRLAEDIVDDVYGVHDVTNQIRVKRMGIETGTMTRDVGRDNGTTTSASGRIGGTTTHVSR